MSLITYFPELKKLVFGKKIRNTIYFHKDAISGLSRECREEVYSTLEKSNLSCKFNVIKIELCKRKLSLLFYEDFVLATFPQLISSTTTNIESSPNVSIRQFSVNNPPILHRKELLLPPDHPEIPKFSALTKQLEDADLFKDSRKIGYKKQWEERLRSAGYKVVDHVLVRLDGSEIEVGDQSTDIGNTVDRHKTALTRYSLSTPIQALAKFQFLEGKHSLFDYGCGKGSDLEILQQNGIEASGWDPHFCPDADKQEADIVNLGFVINVIEEPRERVEAIRSSFALCHQFLCVSAMLGSQTADKGRPFGDGVLTSRNTFQKYFSQQELREYLAAVLDEEPIAVGPGIFFVFRDKEAEQQFLEKRYRRRRTAFDVTSGLPRLSRAEKDKAFYESHQTVLDALWLCWLELGRPPHESEFDDANKVMDLFTTWRLALGFLQRYHDGDVLKTVFDARQEDLRVYFAMRLFEQKRIYRKLAESLQRDVKAFFGSYKSAQEEGKALLFSAGDSALILQACREAAAQSLGFLDDEACLTLHTSMVGSLPSVLRVYVGCATQLYGDISSADLLKIHPETGKLSLMVFDDFENQALPRMKDRIKIRLFDQRIEFYGYGEEFAPPYLYLKSRFMDEDVPHFQEQVAFDEALQTLEVFDFSEYGPNQNTFDATLQQLRLEVDGFALAPSRSLPELDDPCGQYHTFRDFIECGETQARLGLANVPQQVETFNALSDLAVQVINPVMDYFGGIELTYGFCSRELAKHIPGRIDSSRDQHASHELNTRGNLICKRLGAACDFIVPDESMLEVAQWIVESTPFDRLYFYGDDLPLHVSYGPEHNRAIVLMKLSEKGRLYPQVIKADAFLSLSV